MRAPVHFNRPSRQRGVTLIVALIMLVLLTLLALTSANVGRSTIQVVSNMQSRDESATAARQAIEEVISTTRFFQSPTDAIASPCGNTANTRCIDNNGDGTTDVTVKLTPAPTCVVAQTVLNTSLNIANTEEQGCATGGAQSFGIVGSVSNDSLCADSTWEINAIATDMVTEASVQVVQGVSVRVAKDNIETSCP
jgi:Tfp pilus assembly protein PilX